MLTHLSVRNFAIVKSLDIELQKGMTAITGETGAGKSIAIDALGLCLGDRADATMVRPGAEKAEIIASFSPSQAALKWLQDNDLEHEQECIIRRIISNEGRSRAYINGVPTPLQQLKSLGQFLVNIHGQHAHHQLLKADAQRQMLDNYAEHSELLNQVAGSYKSLQKQRKVLAELQTSQEQRQARSKLLEYQVSELDEFAIGENEFEELEAEHKRLSNSQALLEQSQLCYFRLYEADDFNALSAIQESIESLTELQEHDPCLSPVAQMLSEAAIQVDEAAKELRDYVERLEIDPMRMQQVENRYSQAMELARKHQVLPEELYQHHQSLLDELKDLQQDMQSLECLEQEIEQLEADYLQHCQQLHLSRQDAAQRLAEQVEKQIHKMNMTDATFAIQVTFDNALPASSHGQDSIRFMVSTNPGQPADVMEKVVSGGELSRIGLALQVISNAGLAVPTMIFDEVDVGISGPTASIVGQLLKTLGQSTQVLCVTHLPQVAARGHNQMFVSKFNDGSSTETRIISLSERERIEELARLLAGDKLTESAIANARELLSAE